MMIDVIRVGVPSLCLSYMLMNWALCEKKWQHIVENTIIAVSGGVGCTIIGIGGSVMGVGPTASSMIGAVVCLVIAAAAMYHVEKPRPTVR